MERTFIAIGSNIDAESNIPKALRLLAGSAHLIALSTFYRSDPEGDPDAPAFINGAAEIATGQDPETLKWELLRPIEESLGRVRSADKNAARTIDLDLLIYGNRIIANPRLTLPDPGILHYPFVALPLLELVPDLLLPNTSRTLREIADGMDASGLLPLGAFTASLKMEFNL